MKSEGNHFVVADDVQLQTAPDGRRAGGLSEGPADGGESQSIANVLDVLEHALDHNARQLAEAHLFALLTHSVAVAVCRTNLQL